MIALAFLSKFNFVSVYFIQWIFHFLLHGFSSRGDGECHVFAFCSVVCSHHTWVCNLASPRNGKNASLVPGLNTLACPLLPSNCREKRSHLGNRKGQGRCWGIGTCEQGPSPGDGGGSLLPACWEVWVYGAFLFNLSFFLRESLNSRSLFLSS